MTHLTASSAYLRLL